MSGVARVPPLLLLVAITVIDYRTGAEFRMISWVVLVPGIAAAICGVPTTAAFAAPALVTLVAVGGVLAVLACAVRLRGERGMLHMRDVAGTTRPTGSRATWPHSRCAGLTSGQERDVCRPENSPLQPQRLPCCRK